VKQRLLVMNGQSILQQEEQNQWLPVKVDKAKGLKPGIYNLYHATPPYKAKAHSGLILITDKTSVYQQVGKSQYVRHDRIDFEKPPEAGEAKLISYDANGKAVVTAATLAHQQSRKM
jgi:KfrB protein